MSVRPATLARTAPVAAGRSALRGFLEREGIFGWLMLAPGVLFLLAFVAYPFFYGIFLSLQERRVAATRCVGFFSEQQSAPRRPNGRIERLPVEPLRDGLGNAGLQVRHRQRTVRPDFVHAVEVAAGFAARLILRVHVRHVRE